MTSTVTQEGMEVSRDLTGGCFVSTHQVKVESKTLMRHPLSQVYHNQKGCLSMLLFGTPHNIKRVKSTVRNALFENWSTVIEASLVDKARTPLLYIADNPLNSEGLDLVVALCVAHHKGILCSVYECYEGGNCDKYVMGPVDGTPEFILIHHTTHGITAVEVVYDQDDPLVPFREDLDQWAQACEEMGEKLEGTGELDVEPAGLSYAKSVWSGETGSTESDTEKGHKSPSESSVEEADSETSSDEEGASIQKRAKQTLSDSDQYMDDWESQMTQASTTSDETGSKGTNLESEVALAGMDGSSSSKEEMESLDLSGAKPDTQSIDYGKLGRALKNPHLSSKRKQRLMKELATFRRTGTSDLWLPQYPTLQFSTGSESSDDTVARSEKSAVTKLSYADVVKRVPSGKSSLTEGTDDEYKSAKSSLKLPRSLLSSVVPLVSDGTPAHDPNGFSWDPESHRKRFGTKDVPASQTPQAAAARATSSQSPTKYMGSQVRGSDSAMSIKQWQRDLAEAGPSTQMTSGLHQRPREALVCHSDSDSSTSTKVDEQTATREARLDGSRPLILRRKKNGQAKGPGKGIKKGMRDTTWAKQLNKDRDAKFWERVRYAESVGIIMSESELIALALEEKGWLSNDERSKLITKLKEVNKREKILRQSFNPELISEAQVSGKETAEVSKANLTEVDSDKDYNVNSDGSASSGGQPAKTAAAPRPFVLQGIGKKGLKHGFIQNSDEETEKEERVKSLKAKSGTDKKRGEHVAQRHGTSITDSESSPERSHVSFPIEISMDIAHQKAKSGKQKRKDRTDVASHRATLDIGDTSDSDSNKKEDKKRIKHKGTERGQDSKGIFNPAGKETKSIIKKPATIAQDISPIKDEVSISYRDAREGDISSSYSKSRDEPAIISSGLTQRKHLSSSPDETEGSSSAQDSNSSKGTGSPKFHPKGMREPQQNTDGHDKQRVGREVEPTLRETTSLTVLAEPGTSATIKVKDEPEKSNGKSGFIPIINKEGCVVDEISQEESEARVSVNISSVIRTLERMMGTVLVVESKTDITSHEPTIIRSLADVGGRYRKLLDYLINSLNNKSSEELAYLVEHGIMFDNSLIEAIDIGSFIQILGQKYFSVEIIQYVTKIPFYNTLYAFLITGICRILSSQQDEMGNRLFGKLVDQLKDISTNSIVELSSYALDSDHNYMSIQDIEIIFQILYSKEFAQIEEIWSRLSGREKVGLDLTNSHMLSLEQFIATLANVQGVEQDSDVKASKTPKKIISLREDFRILSILVKECESIYDQMFQPNGEYKEGLKFYEVRELKMAGLQLLEDYFKRWHNADRFNYINPDMWEASIRALTTHVVRISSFRRNEMTKENDDAFMDIMGRLYKLLAMSEIMPMVEICRSLNREFRDLMLILKEPAKTEVYHLFESLFFCDNYTQAWQYALRIKGIAYEALFATEYNLEYVPELQKPNLSEIIKNSFPMHYQDFVDLSAKRPVVRSLVPDFYSHRKSIFGDEIPIRVKAYLEKEKEKFMREETREQEVSTTQTTQPNSDTDTLLANTLESSDSYETAPEDSGNEVSNDQSGTHDQKTHIFHIRPEGLSGGKKHHSKSKHTTDTERQRCVRLIKKGKRQGRVYLGLELLADSTVEANASLREVDDYPLDLESNLTATKVDITKTETDVKEGDKVSNVEEAVVQKEMEVNPKTPQQPSTLDDVYEADDEIETQGEERANPMEAEEELVIYEVGYVTDAESKMSIDAGKWAAANSVLSEIGLQTTLIFATDSSLRPKKDWWISTPSSRALRRSVGALFRQLIRYTPIGVREKVIGNITTLKFQRMRGSGHIVRTSTNLENIKGCFKVHRDKIQKRPTGTTLPDEIMEDFEDSLINGCAISPKGAEDIMQLLKDSSKVLVQIFKNTEEAEILLETNTTKFIVLSSWMKQEVKNSICKACYKEKCVHFEQPTPESIRYMATILQESVKVEECCRKSISTKLCLGPIPLYLLKCPNLLGIQHPPDNKEDLGQVTELDQIMGTAFPGRTQPQKRFKRAVDRLCRLALDLNEISAIKNSKGQILLNTSFSSQISKLVSVPKKRLKVKTVEKLKGQLKALTESIDEMLQTKEIESYSDFHKNLVQRLIDNIEKQRNSRCALTEVWVDRIFKSLELTESAAETMVNYNQTIKDRRDNADKNDSFRPPDKSMLLSYFEFFPQSGALGFNRCSLFRLDCLVFQELMSELVRRCAKTTYNMNIQAIGDTCKLLLKFGWFQSLVFYSKLCGTYLTACSEFTGSGVKILKINHTPYNLAIKLPSNKKNNARCCILSLEMDQVLPSFFMNRAIASLGHAMPFVVLVILIQTMQNYRCIDGLLEFSEDDTEYIESMLSNQFDNFREVIIMAHVGNYEASSMLLQSLMPSRRNYMSLSTKERLTRIVVNYTVATGLALVPAMLLNSLNFNSQIQKMRFTVLMGLSMIGRPADMGRKMYASSRRIETYVARTYLQIISYTCLSDISGNIKGWKDQSLFPEVSIPSISLFGMATSGDRHCLTDIYLVHAFNKELDNFDEGSIAVLEELADRHFSWEKHVTKVVGQLNRLPKRKSREGLLSELRNLMGIINLKAPEDLKMKESSEFQAGKSTGSTSSRSARSDRKLWDARSRGRESVMSISSTLEAFSDIEQEGQYAIREKDQCTIYQPGKSRIMKECKRLLKVNPSYTMGIGEVLQAMVEFSKTKFPEVVICQAKRDPKNWASIASVSESTAIVPGPLRKFDIQLCMESTKRMESTKLKKLLKNRLTYLGGSEEKIKTVKSVAKELEELLSCLDVVDEGVKEAVTKGISMARQLRQVTWEQASEMQLHHTILTSDGHNIYYWIKNLKNAVERFWKTDKAVELYKDPLNLKVVEAMKNISDGDTPSMGIEDLNNQSGNMIVLWIRVFDLLIERLKLIKPGELDKFEGEFTNVLNDYAAMYTQYRYILEQKKQNPDLSYQKLEANLNLAENHFLEKYTTTLGKYLNFMFCACLCCPWSRGFRYQESIYLKNILTTIGLKLGDSGGLDDYISAILPTMGVRQFLTTYFVQKFEKPALRQTLDAFFRYNIALYSSNSKPMSYVYNKTIDSTILASHSLIQGVQDVIARSSLQGYDYDFAFTIKIIAYGSHAVAQKLTGKSKRERLPRSVRSKVIYEIIKLMGTSGSAILQEVAFERILDTGHQFFATLAPKAQLGGNRDLFVQETSTKLIHATTEIFAKTLLCQTNDDGLTNSKLKEEILNKSLQQFKISASHHGNTIPKGPGDGGVQLVNFYKVMTVAGDNTKWGPIHCCSFFSLMYQQLLIDHPDWKHYIMLVMLKDLYKEVEIPTASISKILNSLKHDEEFVKNYKLNTSHSELSKELLRISENWSWKPLVQDLINNYLSKGIGCMRCYNHMGQGIHHATSSLLTSMLAEFVKEIVGRFVESELEGLHCTIIHAGSSDDYAKVIITNGSLTELEFEHANNRWKHVMLDAKNLMSAISRLVQVKDSSKTLSGTIVAEFYSEFVLYHRASPAGIKFIITSLINSSITSPITMSQACQVSSQQAFFNSVPHLTNLSFTIYRQQVYFNYVENFIRKYGGVTLGSLCSIGRLYIPKISNMLESGLVIEDIEQTVQSFKVLNSSLRQLPEEDFIVEPPGSVSGDTSSPEEGTEYTLDLNSSQASGTGQRVRILNKALDAGIATEFESHTIKSTEAKEVISALTRQQSSNYYIECDKIVNEMYKENLCNHYSKVWHNQFITRFIQHQPDVVKSLCIPPSGSFGYNTINVDSLNYSVTLIEVLMRDVLVAIMFSHYKKPDTLSFGKRLKASYDREESSFYEDPFIQIKPNSLEREMKNIREAHDMVKKIVTEGAQAQDLASAISSCLVKMNNMTEDHLGETERLMQAIRSRSIVWGLSGGLKELSVPMYSIFINGFFFLDNAKICTEARWASSRREGHMDSTAREIGQRPRSKFTFWLDTVLSGRLRSIERNYYGVLDSRACVAWFNTVSVPDESGDITQKRMSIDGMSESTDTGDNTTTATDPISTVEPDPLSITLLQRVVKSRKKVYISLDVGLCEKYGRELISLTLQFSNTNRQKILSLETNQNLIVRPADYTTIVKTKLFSRGTVTQTNNNPAVVVAFKLSSDSVYTLKPAGIDYSNLCMDGITIAEIHPAISEICLEIIGKTNDGVAFNEEEVHEYTRVLTSLCRLASSHRYSTMSFYALRPTESSEETNLVEVISYGLQEGKQVTFPVTNSDLAAYSERFYVILEAIGCINQLPLMSEHKTTIMQNFLTWTPSESSLEVPESCAFINYKASLIANFGDASLASVLLSEQHQSHSQNIVINCGYLSQFIMNPKSLQSRIPYTGTRPTFFTEGNKSSQGNFRYYSPDGNAAGIFISGRLHIHIDKMSNLLVDNVCKHVLGWISGHIIRELTEEDIRQFLLLLPTCDSTDIHIQDKGTGELCFIQKTGTFHSAMEVIKGGKIGYPMLYYVENHMMTTFDNKQEQQPIVCEWQPDKLLLYYQLIHDEIKPSESFKHSIQILMDSGLSNYKDVLKGDEGHSSQKIVIATIPLSAAVNFKSLALLHLYLTHVTGTRSHSLGIPTKEATLERLSTDAAISQISKYRKEFSKFFRWKEKATKKSLGRQGDQVPSAAMERDIRNRLNSVSSKYTNMIDWVAVQNILKMLSLSNSTVIADEYELRKHVKWKVVPSSLDTSLLSSEEGQLFRSCMELDSLKVRPLFCRLSITEDGCRSMVELSVHCKMILQTEGLSVDLLNSMLFITALYNRGMKRGKDGIMTIEECYHGTLPLRRNIGICGILSCSIDDGDLNMTLILDVSAEERGNPMAIAVKLKNLLQSYVTGQFSTAWRAMSVSLTDSSPNQPPTQLLRYKLIPSFVTKYMTYTNLIRLLYPSYKGEKAMSLCCKIIMTLLDDNLEDPDCTLLAQKYRKPEEPSKVLHISSGEILPKIASGEDILDALDKLEELEGNVVKKQPLTEEELRQIELSEMIEHYRSVNPEDQE